MADVESTRHTEIAETQSAAARTSDVAARASALADEIFGSDLLDQVPYLEIAVEAPGWTKSVAVEAPARPGAVRAAVEKTLRELGLT